MLNKSASSQRILLLILLPPLLMGLLLGVHFLWNQSTQRQASLLERGSLLGEQLAILTAHALLAADQPYLQRLASESLEHPELRDLRILAPDGQILASSGPRAQAPAPELESNRLTFSITNDQSRFRQPVLGRHLLDSGEEEEQLLGWVDLELSHQGSQLGLYQDLLALSLIYLLGLGLLFPLALRLADNLHRPVHDIGVGLTRLRDGQLNARLPCDSGNPEMDALARDFNHMASQLQHALEELQSGADQASDDLRQSMDTMERNNIVLKQELDLVRKRASEAHSAQSAFLANMGHEIRTPLNAVLGFIRLLLKTRLDNHQRDCVEHINESAQELLSLLNNILDLSKLEAGKLQLVQGPLNLRDLIEDTLTMFAPAAHDKQLELVSLYYRDVPLMVSGDAQRLRQILGNLLSNAIKFSHESEVIVRTQLEDMYNDQVFLRISVQDSGIGISPEDQRQLFSPFSQVDSSSTRRASGSGLGLAICKSLIAQMGGEIGVNSEPGEGSEFWLSLKLHCPGDKPLPPPAQLAGMQVFLLEPHEATRYQLLNLLEDCRMQVQQCRDLDSLRNAVCSATDQPPLRLAVLGLGFQHPDAEQLTAILQELLAHGCRSLLLSSSRNSSELQARLPQGSALLNRPVGTLHLMRSLSCLADASQPCELEENSLPQIDARVLCVDDNPANLMLVRALLEDLGVQVTSASSGQDAVIEAARQRFDMIFMDVQMPGMDGLQATEAIRRDERSRKASEVPIIALTAHALEDERRRLLQSGMDDYLSKPASPQQLQQMLRKWGQQSDEEVSSMPEAPQQNSQAIFDPEESLQLAAGKPQLASDMLRMLLDSLPAEQATIDTNRREDDQPMLIANIHRLHGACRYCGVPELRQACQQAETLLKQGQPAGPALDELNAAIQRLIQLAPSLP